MPKHYSSPKSGRCLRDKKTIHSRKGRTKYIVCRTRHPNKQSRGWKKSFPRKGRERNLIREQCGSKCFLEPKTLGFPICKAYRSHRGRSPCTPSCKGILSAYIRARQWKHVRTAAKAKRAAKKSRCPWFH